MKENDCKGCAARDEMIRTMALEIDRLREESREQPKVKASETFQRESEQPF